MRTVNIKGKRYDVILSHDERNPDYVFDMEYRRLSPHRGQGADAIRQARGLN